MTRRTLAPGIYEDRYGREVRWPGGKPKRYPLDAPLEQLVAYRKRMRQQTAARRRVHGGGSFVRDVARFLRERRHRPCYKSDKSHLRPWVERFGRASRFAITHEGVQGAVNEWARQGYSPRELRHRVKLLQRLFRHLDPGQPTPCDGVTRPKIVKRKPRPVPAHVVRDVALNLRKQEIRGIGRLRSAKTRARFLVLALTGARPVQVMRATRSDLDLERGIWYVEPAKGDDGATMALNAQQRAAWQLFIAAEAWGRYDARSFSKTLQRNGWPKGIRPYNLRHTVGQTLRELGADLGDIQDHLGHASPDTTSQFYVGPSLDRLRAISARLEGRVNPFAVELPQPTSTTGREQKEKKGEKRRSFAPQPDQRKSRSRRQKRAKTA